MPNISSERSAITVSGVTKKYGDVTALNGLDFTVKTGEVIGLLGPNGSGKTTIINIMSTLLAADSGQVSVAGYNVREEAHKVRQSIALTGQFAAVDDALTGVENLVLFGRLKGLTKSAAKVRAEELLEKFSLTDAGTQRAGTYSGGMRRRLDLAASIVAPAQVVFLDEPTTGLDPRSRNELWDVVRELQADGLTIVLTTQYLEEADQLADRIIVIDQGQVIAGGTPEELKSAAGGPTIVVTPAQTTDAPILRRALQDFGAVSHDENTGAITIQHCSGTDLAPVALAASAANVTLADVSVRVPTLDDVFLQLTGAATSTSATQVTDETEPTC